MGVRKYWDVQMTETRYTPVKSQLKLGLQSTGGKTSRALQLQDKCLVRPSASVHICARQNYMACIFSLPSGSLQSRTYSVNGGENL